MLISRPPSVSRPCGTKKGEYLAKGPVRLDSMARTYPVGARTDGNDRVCSSSGRLRHSGSRKRDLFEMDSRTRAQKYTRPATAARMRTRTQSEADACRVPITTEHKTPVPHKARLLPHKGDERQYRSEGAHEWHRGGISQMGCAVAQILSRCLVVENDRERREPKGEYDEHDPATLSDRL